jgi:hypothetical protein
LWCEDEPADPEDLVMRPLALLFLLVALAGCGASNDRRAQTQETKPRTIPTPEIRGLSPLIPTEAVGPPPRGASKVIEDWAAAVRRGDWGHAADLIARGAHVQTGPDVERLTTRNLALAWNISLPCGARVERIGGAKGYAIVRFRLMQRREGACGDIGEVARTAIRVADGRIVGWYALS